MGHGTSIKWKRRSSSAVSGLRSPRSSRDSFPRCSMGNRNDLSSGPPSCAFLILLGVLMKFKPTRLSLIVLLCRLVTAALDAQQPDSGTVTVIVRESMGMVDGILIRSENRSATTDAGGRARLVLPAGRRTLLLTRIGFVPKRVNAMVIADSTVALTVDVAMEGMAEMEEVTISATRTERLAGQTPLRVEVLDEMEVDENTLMAPSGITMLLNETPGLRVHHASPTLGTGSV